MECAHTIAGDWQEDGTPGTVCPAEGICGSRGRFLGCPYMGLHGQGQGATKTCPGWYRKQPLFMDMMRAVRLRDFWANDTPDNLPHPLVEFYFWYEVYKK